MRVWRWPLLLGVLTLTGLVSALLGEGGAWWIYCWVALSPPLVVCFACLVRAGRRP